MAIMLRTKYMRRDARRHPWWSKLVVFIYFERSLITGCNFYWHSSSISKLLKEQKLINSSPRRLIAWHLHKQHRWYLVTTGQSRARLPMSRCCDGSRSSSESVSVSWYKLSVTPTISSQTSPSWSLLSLSPPSSLESVFKVLPRDLVITEITGRLAKCIL